MIEQSQGAKEAEQKKARMNFLLSLSRTQLYAYALFQGISFKQLQKEVELETNQRAFLAEQAKYLP